MSGECYICGEHTLECTCKPYSRRQENGPQPNERFFYKGKFFSNKKEFWKYVDDWPFTNVNQETFFREWDHLGKYIWFNLGVREIEMSNGALNEILQENLIYLLNKFFENKKDSKDGMGEC